MRSDSNPRQWDQTFGNRSDGVKKDVERELEKSIWYDEVEVVMEKLKVWP